MSNPIQNPSKAFAEYAKTGSEEAFRTLVGAHFGLVHGTATRLLNGDSHAAQDVAQEVFTLLARKAHRLPREITPASWLYRQTYRRSLNSMRRDSRRRRREAIAATELEPSQEDNDEANWQDLAPELDRALTALSAPDRDAVVLHYLDGRSHGDVGVALGVGAEAARKRTERALDRLRERLVGRGVVFHSTAPLAALLAANAIAPAPAGAAVAAVAATAQGALDAGGIGILSVLTDAPAMLVGVVTGLVVATAAGAFSTEPPATEPTIDREVNPVLTALTAREKKPAWVKRLRAKPSTEEILARLLELAAAPDHSLTRLQREATLAAIANDQFGELFSLAANELDGAERGMILQPVFMAWAELDPGAALNATIASKGGVIRSDDVFRKWLDQDFDSAIEWLAANAASLPAAHNPQLYFEVGTGLMETAGVESALKFVMRLPEGDQKSAFAQLLPRNIRDTEWALTEGGRHVEALRVLRSLEDRDQGKRLEDQFWKGWAEHNPPEAEKALVEIDSPETRLKARIRIASSDGSGFHRKTEEQATEQIRAALDEAVGIGRDEGEVLAEIFKAIWSHGGYAPHSTFGKAMMATRKGAELDPGVAENASSILALGFVGYSGGIKEAFGWTDYIHDDEFRAQVEDGLLLRLQVAGDEIIKKAIDSGEVPEEMQTRLSKLNSEYTLTP